MWWYCPCSFLEILLHKIPFPSLAHFKLIHFIGSMFNLLWQTLSLDGDWLIIHIKLTQYGVHPSSRIFAAFSVFLLVFCLFFVVLTYTVIWYLNFYIKFKQSYLESIFLKGGLIIRCTLIHHNQQQTNISKLIGEKSLFNKWYSSTWMSACRRMQIHATLHKTQVQVNKQPQHKPR